MAGRGTVCILRVGTTVPSVRSRRGDFAEWILGGMGRAPEAAVVCDPREVSDLPDPAGFAGVVVTGAAEMITDEPEWSVRSQAWVALCVEAGTPLLGICYGHQLLAQAFGGRAGWNPAGREVGTVGVELLDTARADPLFADLAPSPAFQSSHSQSVLELPSNARLLASTALDPHAAFALGDKAWGVQFHPEFDADIVRGYIAERRDRIAEEGLDPEALTREAQDTADGPGLLEAFERFVRARRA